MSKNKIVAIDLTFEIDGQIIALKSVGNTTLLEHWLKVAALLEPERIDLIVKKEEDRIKEMLSNINLGDIQPALIHETEEGSFVIGGNSVYNVNKMKKYAARKPCILWKINSLEDIASAHDELVKTDWFPIGRYYIEPFSRILVKFLKDTAVTPNELTCISILMGILSGLFIFAGNTACNITAALLYLAFWLLDITDGKLARAKNVVSKFGAWFDSVSGEAVDFWVHLAVSAAFYFRTGNNLFLWAGMFYFIGKYLFIFSMQTANFRFSGRGSKGLFVDTLEGRSLPMISAIRASHLFHDSDVRIHVMALAMASGIPYVPLILYAAYYNLWFVLKIVVESYRYRKRF